MYNILYKYKRCCLYLHEADEKQIVNKCEKNDERGRKCEKTMREAENVKKNDERGRKCEIKRKN